MATDPAFTPHPFLPGAARVERIDFDARYDPAEVEAYRRADPAGYADREARLARLVHETRRSRGHTLGLLRSQHALAAEMLSLGEPDGMIRHTLAEIMEPYDADPDPELTPLAEAAAECVDAALAGRPFAFDPARLPGLAFGVPHDLDAFLGWSARLLGQEPPDLSPLPDDAP